MLFYLLILLLPVSLGSPLMGFANETTVTPNFQNILDYVYPKDKTLDILDESVKKIIHSVEDLIGNINQDSVAYLENLSNERMTQIIHLFETPCNGTHHQFDGLKKSFKIELGLLEIAVREAISELKDKVLEMKRSVDIERSALEMELVICKLTGDSCNNEIVLSTQIQCLNDSCTPPKPTEINHAYLIHSLYSLNQTKLPSFISRINLPTECSDGRFKCESGQCINFDYVCDGEYDCQDQSDERSPCTHKCSGKRCRNLNCISQDQICNGIDDCGDGTDEKGCPSYDHCGIESEKYLCSDKTKCLSLMEVCDGKADCIDGSDESDRCSDSSICKNCSLAGGSCLHTPTGPICLRKCPNNFILYLNDGICIRRNSTIEPFIVYNSNSFLGIVKKLKILSSRFSSGFFLLKKNMELWVEKTFYELSKCTADNNIVSLSSPFLIS